MKKLLLTIFIFTVIFSQASAATTDKEAFATVKILVIPKTSEFLDEILDADKYVSGSGFIIDSEKEEVLTNYHVVKDYIEDPAHHTLLVCFTFSYTKEPVCAFRATVDKHSESIDLALLRIEEVYDIKKSEFVSYRERYDISKIPNISLNPYLNPDSLKLGDRISILGFPNYGGENITLTEGVVGGFQNIEVRAESYVEYIKTDAKLNPGNSGGAAFDSENRLIGMPTAVAGGDGNIGYLIPLRTIRIFLNNRDGNISVQNLEDRIEELKEDYEKWVIEQCGENSKWEKGCICNEGYEENKQSREGFSCIPTKAEIEDAVPEPLPEIQCGAYSEVKEGKCVCVEGYEFQGSGEEQECKVAESSAPEPLSFSDVPATHKNREAILYLREKEILQGYPNGTFQPLRPVNRVELLKILVESQAKDFITSVHDTNCFPDVPKGEWFTSYVCYAKAKGWVKGYEDGNFRPGQTVSKAEAIKIILEAFAIALKSGELSPFSDVRIGDWFTAYVSTAAGQRFLEETSGLFLPHSGMTRAGVSEIIYRVLQFVEQN